MGKLSDLAIPVSIVFLGLVLCYRVLVRQSPGGSQVRVLGISELIQQVKGELEAAERQRLVRAEPPLFSLKAFDLEIHYVVTSSRSDNSEFTVQAVTLGGTTEWKTEDVQKIVLHMEAVGDEKRSQSVTGGVADDGVIVHGPTPPTKVTR
jgi:hypothetical protein